MAVIRGHPSFNRSRICNRSNLSITEIMEEKLRKEGIALIEWLRYDKAANAALNFQAIKEDGNAVTPTELYEEFKRQHP